MYGTSTLPFSFKSHLQLDFLFAGLFRSSALSSFLDKVISTLAVDCYIFILPEDERFYILRVMLLDSLKSNKPLRKMRSSLGVYSNQSISSIRGSGCLFHPKNK